MVYLFIAILLFVLIKCFLVFLLNIISYILALFLFLSKKKYNISKTNILLIRLQNNKCISWLQLNYIILNSNKNLIFNTIVLFLQKYIHLNLKNYYNIKNFHLPKKCQLVMMHYGLFYDLLSGQSIFNKSLVGIYKGKFKNISTEKIHMMRHNMINYYKLNKYHIIVTPIDHKSNSDIFVNFLGRKVKFHSNLINYSVKSNRDLYMYYIKININSFTLNIHKIDTNVEFNDLIQNISTDMTNNILKEPGQYCWNYKLFNKKIYSR